MRATGQTEYVLDELQWFLDMGQSPFFALREVGCSAVRASTLAYTHGRPGIGRWVEQERKRESRGDDGR